MIEGDISFVWHYEDHVIFREKYDLMMSSFPQKSEATFSVIIPKLAQHLTNKYNYLLLAMLLLYRLPYPIFYFRELKLKLRIHFKRQDNITQVISTFFLSLLFFLDLCPFTLTHAFGELNQLFSSFSFQSISSCLRCNHAGTSCECDAKFFLKKK